jgi:hypothetical protein
MATAPAWDVPDIARRGERSGAIPAGMRFATTAVVRRMVDGEACVAALLEAGFHVHHRANGLALLKRSGKVVLVPAVDFVTPQMFDSIARSAGLTTEELERHLPRAPRASGTFTRTQLDSLGAGSELSPPSSANGGRRRRR